MPGVTKYNLVDDAHDLRLPMHNDEVFKHGVCFEAKVRTLCNRYFLGGGAVGYLFLDGSNARTRAVRVTASVTTTISIRRCMLRVFIDLLPLYICVHFA